MAKEGIAQHLADQSVQTLVSKAPYAAAGATIIGGFTLNEWLSICGIISIPITLFLNWYMQNKRLKLLREAIDKRVDVSDIQ